MKLIPSLRISQKLPLALIGSAVVVAAGVGISSYLVASNALETQARQQLATIAFERANQLATYLQNVETDLVKTADADFTKQALGNFAQAWIAIDGLEGGAAKQLRDKLFATDPAERAQV